MITMENGWIPVTLSGVKRTSKFHSLGHESPGCNLRENPCTHLYHWRLYCWALMPGIGRGFQLKKFVCWSIEENIVLI